MMKKSLFILVVCLGAILSGCTNKGSDKSNIEVTESPVIVSSGTVERFTMPCEYAKERIIDVWLPEGYSTKKKYSVLYAQDGHNLFDATKMFNNQEWRLDEVTDSLMTAGTIKNTIIVGVHCTRHRFEEYLPQKAMGYLSEEGSVALKNEIETCKGDSYLKFLVEELKPVIENRYRVRKGPENTSIIGSSMGGLISVYAICEYPDVFGSAACVSTHWPGLIPNPMDTTYAAREGYFPEAMCRYLAASLPDPANHKIYFDHGDMTLDATYGNYQKAVDKIMEEAGYTSENWITRVYPGDAHVESSWASRVHIPLIFMLGKKALKPELIK
jgi:hypothetical protein